jgi:hypothetical protein
MYKRAIIITENEKLIVRHDINVNGYDNIEKDLFNFIIMLDKTKNMINSKKVMNMLKAYHGITLSDTVDVFVNNKDWRINDNTENKNKEYCDTEV